MWNCWVVKIGGLYFFKKDALLLIDGRSTIEQHHLFYLEIQCAFCFRAGDYKFPRDSVVSGGHLYQGANTQI